MLYPSLNKCSFYLVTCKTTRSRAANKSFFNAAQTHLRCPCPNYGRSSNTARVQLLNQLRKFAKIYDIMSFGFGANPREFYSWNSKILFRKTDISSFSKGHIGWEIFWEEWNVEIPCWVITCDPLFARILVSYKYINKPTSVR